MDLLPSGLGPWRPRLAAWTGLGVIVEGLVHRDGVTAAPASYVDEVLLSAEHRDGFLALIDRVGLVVCRNVVSAEDDYAAVRGRSSRGRLSQSELYHHDGCSGPAKPRVVEIRCPYQTLPRAIATAIAPFAATVYAMLDELPRALHGADAAVVAWRERRAVDGQLPADELDDAQGAVNRIVRLAMNAEATRGYFRAVDARAGAFREPWQMGECRFIANANPGTTMQHRRAYLEAPGRPNGRLVKRWPDGPAMHE